MGVTNFPNGIAAYGVPVMGGGQLPSTTGSYFFVHSGTGNSTNTGTDADHALATIDQAINKCTADKGDVIVVMPGHAENISTATSLVADVDGISIIGLGNGRGRPVLTFTATAGSVEIDGTDIRVSNIVFNAGISAVVVGINVDGADITIDNCEFNFSTTAFDFVTMIDTDAVARFTVDNCRFITEEAAGTEEAIRLDTATGARISNCTFNGDFTDGCIVGEGALSTGVEIINNWFYNSDTTAGLCIDLNVACTGFIADNSMSTAAAVAPDTLLDPGSCGCANNVASSGNDTNAVPVPTSGIAPWRVVTHASSVFAGGTSDLHGNDGGALDPYTVFTVTGNVEVRIVGIINTSLTGTSATLEVGVAGNTAQFIAQATATDLDDGDVWTDAGSEAGADVWPEESHIINDGADIIETVATADVTAGQIDYYCLWRPLGSGGLVVSA